MSMKLRHKLSTAGFLAISCVAGFAQMIDPKTASGMASEVWKSNGLVGIQSLALVMAIGVLGWMMQRLFTLVVQVVRAISEVKAAIESMVKSLERMPCVWLEQRSKPEEKHQHRTPSPFGDIKITSAETPT